MKLQKFKERNNKQKSIIIFTIACVLLITGVFLYKTFASFQVIENEDLINGDVSDPGDIYFVFYKDNQLTKEMPQKGTGYAYDYEKSHCEVPGKEESKAIPYFDSIDWSITVRGMTERPTKCTIYFYQGYQEDILKGADPVLERPLVPVKISETETPSDVTYSNPDNKVGGKVTKADPSKEWYNYERKEWANAVILRDEKENTYQPGDEIKEEDIESYFVWIPRYRYQLKDNESDLNQNASLKGTYKNLNNVEEFYQKIGGNKGLDNAFKIIFESIETTPSNDNTKDGWLTPPAFTAFNSNGFWVGKFETGYNQNSDPSKEITTTGWTTENAQKNTEDSSKIIIKSNVYSWRGIQPATAFYTSYNYQRELESHMMKNTEWGAVVYLTQSKYGRCESDNGKCEEVRLNNTENFITGSSAKSDPTCGWTTTNEPCNIYETVKSLYEDGTNVNNYYNQASKESSTTGNYSGIYDMSGGSWEYVMGVMKSSTNNASPASGKDKSLNSGFQGLYSYCNENGETNGENCNTDIAKTDGKEWPSSKYYDLYEYDVLNHQYQRGVLGDATKEFGPFNLLSYKKGDGTEGSLRYGGGNYYADWAGFIGSINPWFARGGARHDGTDAGIFGFNAYHGAEVYSHSFRIILTP